jgi:hypothetical protein
LALAGLLALTELDQTGLLLLLRLIVLPTVAPMRQEGGLVGQVGQAMVVEMAVREPRRGRRFLAAAVLEDTRALAGLGHRRQPAQTGQAVVVAAVLDQTQVP